jgi:hypothetical protein
LPLNLAHVERFFTRLNIRDRDEGTFLPFTLRQQQKEVFSLAEEHLVRRRRLFMIFLKARRVGLSTLATGIGQAHCIAHPGALARCIAQNAEVAAANFAMACGFREDCRDLYPGAQKPTKKTLIWPHSDGPDSQFTHHTAATVHGQRGLTSSFLHLTEAAFYPYSGAFTSLMNTVSKDKNNIIIVETTANGLEGPGEAYYQAWEAAVAGDNEFLAIFLPWWEDPAYQLPEEFALDAPRDEYEKFLMHDIKHWKTGKKVKITKSQIAWFRETLSTKCEQIIERWRQEYPSTPEEAFIATGNPAFTLEEMQFAENSVVKAPWRGRCILTPDGKHGELQKSLDGPLSLYEIPQKGHHYFIGVDSARGEESTMAPGDYAALGCINAETGAVAATYMARVSPEELSSTAAALGYYFNGAMLNVELNNLGYVTMRELRDRLFYPSQYLWKGRDDRADKSKQGMAYGFETSDRYRRMMFNLYRTALHRKEVLPKDRTLVDQMKKAKMEMGWRWNVAVGHDDLLMSILLAWIAKEQNHPTTCQPRASKNIMMTKEELENAGFEPGRQMPEWMKDPTVTVGGVVMMTGNDRIAKRIKYEKEKRKVNRLEWV